MPNCSNLLAAAVLIWTAGRASATEVPSAETLLDAVMAAPAVPYQGRVMVTQWYGKQTHAVDMRVFVSPPDKIRREFLSPDGNVNRISISDGDVEVVHLVRSGKTIRGDAVRSYEKVLSPEAERSALISNYELSSSTGEKIAGRLTWRLLMKPKSDGKPWQSLWIDPETKVVLRSKRFLPKRPFATQAQFGSFEPGKPQDPALFIVDQSSAGVIESRGLSPDFLTLDQLNKATGAVTNLPEKLPGGFVFESADAFPVNNRQVRHARYTDGLTVISIFLTDRPVKLPKGGALRVSDIHLPGPLSASSAGKITRWGSGKRHYMLIGDVSRELVAEIVKSLR
jgi:negative regulator of sigma E activity